MLKVHLIAKNSICDAFPDRTLAEEEEAIRYLNSKLSDDVASYHPSTYILTYC